ncbi:hypothetical protein [Vibrio makurazakiensis]
MENLFHFLLFVALEGEVFTEGSANIPTVNSDSELVSDVGVI